MRRTPPEDPLRDFRQIDLRLLKIDLLAGNQAIRWHLPGLGLPLKHPKLRLENMRELIFEVTQEADGGYWTECLTETIVTEGLIRGKSFGKTSGRWSRPSILTSLTKLQPLCGCIWFEMKSSLTHETAAAF
jgi:hypothetical protein